MSRIETSLRRRVLSRKAVMDLLTAHKLLLLPQMPEGVMFLHQGRCGSTVLAELLGQHSRLVSWSEIFKRFVERGQLPVPADALLRHKRAFAYPKRSIVEVKFFECQHLSLMGLTIEEFVEMAKSCGYRRFIILNRRNYLRKVVSTAHALESGGKWHIASNTRAPKRTVHLDVQNVMIQGKVTPMVELFRYMDEQYARLRAKLGGENAIELTYEQDVFEDPKAGYAKVCQWLDIPVEPTVVTLSKTTPYGLNEIVENFEEVVETLSSTKFAWMLEAER